MQPVKLTATSFNLICPKQIKSLVAKARKGAPFSQGVSVVWPDSTQEFLPLKKLLWRQATLKG